VLVEAGGVRPRRGRDLKGRCLSFAEREEIALGRAAGESMHVLAYERAGRPKPAKLVTNLVLRGKIEKDLEKKYSPEQIVGWLRLEFPDDP